MGLLHLQVRRAGRSMNDEGHEATKLNRIVRTRVPIPSGTPPIHSGAYAPGRGTSKSLQIFLARSSLISLCRGTVETFFAVRLTNTV